MSDVIRINGTKYGAVITLCDNVETARPDELRETDWGEECVRESIGEASRVIFNELGSFPSTDSFFANWHGGKYGHPDAPYGHCEWYRLVEEFDDDGELCSSEWEWVSEIPADVERFVYIALELASAAAHKVDIKHIAADEARQAEYALEDAESN